MKKILSIGLMTVLAMSVGCSKSENPSVAATPQEAVPITEVTSTEQEEVIEITADDFKPFFETLYGYSEDVLMTLNENNDINYIGYTNNLEVYKKEIKQGIGKFFTEDLLKKLDEQQDKLELDVPKKVLLNGYVADAVGKIENVEIKSIRDLGENKVYEVAITSTNNVEPEDDFNKTYIWSRERGYYIKREGGVGESAPSINQSFMYANQSNAVDKIKLVSHYWVEINDQEAGKGVPFTVAGLRQAGGLDVPLENKGWIGNTQYVERIPYYEEVTEKQKQLILKVFSTMMKEPQETYYYYEKLMNASFDYYQTFWRDLHLSDSVALMEENYKNTFATTINPYKDNIIQLALNDKTVQIVPSIYSSQLQPTFIVTLPVKALLKDNSVVYYYYKYFISTENNKVEAIQFMKMEKITEEEYLAESITEEEVVPAEGEVAPVEGEATTAVQ